MTTRQLLRVGLGLVISATFVWLLSRQVHARELNQAFRNADATWLVLALASFAAGYVLRIQRWRLLLGTPALRWRDCAGPFLAGFALNNLLPLRAGDVVRTTAFTRTLSRPAAAILATLVIERLLDLASLLLLLALATWVFLPSAGLWGPLTAAVSFAAATAIALVLALPGIWRVVLAPVIDWVRRGAPSAARQLTDATQQGLSRLEGVAQRGTLTRVAGLSGLSWAAEGVTFWCTARAIAGVAVPSAAWYALPVSTLSTLLPGAPGHLGTFDYFGAQAMTQFGNTPATAVAYMLLLHVLLWLPPTIVGLVYLAWAALRASAKHRT